MEKRHNLFDAFAASNSRGKKIIAFALVALMVFCFMPALAWQGEDGYAYGDNEAPSAGATVEELRGIVGEGGALAGFEWDDTDFPDPTDDLDAIGDMKDQIEELKDKYDKMSGMSTDGDENSDEMEEITGKIEALQGKYDAYIEAIGSYIAAAGTYDGLYSEYDKKNAAYTATTAALDTARTSFSTTLTSDLISQTGMSFSPNPVSRITSPTLANTSTGYTLATAAFNNLGSQGIAIAQKLLPDINITDLSNIGATLGNYVDDLASTINDESSISVPNALAGIKLLNQNIGAVTTSTVTYTIPEATKTLAKTVVDLNGELEGVDEPIPPLNNDLTKAWADVSAPKAAATTAFAKTADPDSGDSDYIEALKQLNAALTALGVVEFTVKGTKDGSSVDGATLNIPKPKAGPSTTTRAIELELEYPAGYDDSSEAFNVDNWTITTEGDEVITESSISDGKLTLTIDTSVLNSENKPGKDTVTVGIGVTTEDDVYDITVKPLTFDVQVKETLGFSIGGNEDENAGGDEDAGESGINVSTVNITEDTYTDQVITIAASGGTGPYTYSITPLDPDTDNDTAATPIAKDSTQPISTFDTTPSTNTEGSTPVSAESIAVQVKTYSLSPMGVGNDIQSTDTFSATSVNTLDATQSTGTNDTPPISDFDSRITINGGTITIGKDTNTGLYVFKVKITDNDGDVFETTITLNVVNDFDTLFEEKIKELEDTQKQIDALINRIKALLPADMIDQDSIDELDVDLTGPLYAMWNDGDPKVTGDMASGLINTFLGIVGAFGLPETITAPIRDTIETYTTELLTSEGISVSKQVFVVGGSINDTEIGGMITTLSTTINTIIDGINNSLSLIPGISGITIPNLTITEGNNIPSVMDSYIDTARMLMKEINPTAELFDKYDALQSHVVNTDYAGLKSVDAVNTYIQDLYTHYSAFDAALANFDENSVLVKGIVNGVIGSVNELVGAGLGLGSDSDISLQELIRPLITQNITNEALRGQIDGLLGQALDTVSGAITEQAGKLPDEFTLADIVGYSHQLKDGLQSIAGVSALITGAVNVGKGFNLADYDLLKINQLKTYVEEIYAQYYEAVKIASGVAPEGEEDPTAILAKLKQFEQGLGNNPDIKEALAIYDEIVAIYGRVSCAIEWVTSGDAQTYLGNEREKLIDRLSVLAHQAIVDGKKELSEAIAGLILQVGTAAMNELANPDSDLRQAVDRLFDDVEGLLAPLEPAYNTAIAAYKKAKADYETALRVLEKAHKAYQNIEGFIGMIGGIDYEDFFGGLWDDAQNRAKRLNAYIDAALRAIPNPKIAASGSGYTTFTTTGDAINFTTNVDRVFNALQKIGVAKPVYVLTSVDSDIDIDGIFTLSKGGALTLNGGVDQYMNGGYGISVDLVFSADTTFLPYLTDGLMGKLNSWFEPVYMTVTVDLPLDKAELLATINDASSLEDKGTKSQAAFEALQAAIDAANGVYGTATKQIDIDEAAGILAEAIEAFNDSIDIAELSAAIATGAALTLGDTKSQAAYDILQAAIDAANAIYLDADLGNISDPADIAAAVTALETAIAAYNAFDNTALTVTIADAAAIQQGAKSLAAFNDLLSAIETARNARGAATQSEINTALSNLRVAIATFYGSPDETVSTVSVDRFALATTLTQATVTVRGNKSATAFTILQSAIVAANTVFFNANATQEEVDAARLALSNAIIAFNNSADEAIYGGEGEDEGEDGSDDTTLAPAAPTPPDSDEPEDTTGGQAPAGLTGTNEGDEAINEPEPEAAPPEDEELVVSEIPGQAVPQSSGADVGAGTPGAAAPSESRGTWSLVNLLLGIVAVLLMAWILARHAIAPGRGKKSANGLAGRYTEKRAPRKTAMLVVGALCLIAAVILLFVLTENIQLPMGAANGNTVFYAGAVAIEIAALAFFSKKAGHAHNAKA